MTTFLSIHNPLILNHHSHKNILCSYFSIKSYWFCKGNLLPLHPDNHTMVIFLLNIYQLKFHERVEVKQKIK